MGEWTAFGARHGCGEQLLYDGAPVYVFVETQGGWTQRVTLVTTPHTGSDPIPDDGELDCPCGNVNGRAGDARRHFDQASRRWDQEHPPPQLATGARP